MTYFDHNATSPVIPAARQAWLDATEQFIGNPSSPHRIGARADAALTEAREKLAAMLACDPDLGHRSYALLRAVAYGASPIAEETLRPAAEGPPRSS